MGAAGPVHLSGEAAFDAAVEEILAAGAVARLEIKGFEGQAVEIPLAREVPTMQVRRRLLLQLLRPAAAATVRQHAQALCKIQTRA